MQKKLLLIDANSLIHRSFHALPDLQNVNGFPTGALYGLLNMILKILDREKPDYIAAAFDRPEPTFRKKLSDSYKAHRPKAPDALILQIQKARDVLSAFNIRSFEIPGYEADDIIGTLAKKFKEKVYVKILTGDLDALQLVEDEKIVIITLRKGVTDIVEYDEAAVIERYGVSPERLVDWKALVGDASDNISGVPGIGAKGATKLLSLYHGVEEMLEANDEKNPLLKKVKDNKEEALLSKTLSMINTSAPVDPSISELSWIGFDKNSITPLLEELEFQNLLKRLNFEKKIEEKKEVPLSLFQQKGSLPSILSNDVECFLDAQDFLKSIKKNKNTKTRVAYDWKSIYKEAVLGGHPFIMDASFFDLMIAGLLLDPDAKDSSIRGLSRRFLHKEVDSALLLVQELYVELKKRILEEGLLEIMENIEMPLVSALAEMELWGIGINETGLSKLRDVVKNETNELEKKIYKLAGVEFNLNSPKQLGEILFKKLSIIPEKRKKTKTGAFSTREGVLETLREKHQIIPLIMEYRENAKMLGTYIDPLLALSPQGRIHTTFLQMGASTGRLASQAPNLQNIPQSSKWSRMLRDCFLAEEGYSFLAFDYSQLELRILAHLSKDAGLLQSFALGKDIHTMTAQKIFNIKDVDQEKRRVAKTLNFGVVYGMGARAFASVAHVSKKEAERYIREYFREFHGIKDWQEAQKKHAKRFGWLANENGRKRWFSGFKNFSEVERAAINMPIQSVEADIIKLAIIAVNKFFKENYNESARIVLTVHDELIVEVKDAILSKSAREVKKIMESCYPLSVPLVVEVKTGRTLGSMESC